MGILNKKLICHIKHSFSYDHCVIFSFIYINEVEAVSNFITIDYKTYNL